MSDSKEWKWEPMEWVEIPFEDDVIAFSWSKQWGEMVVDIEGMYGVEELEAIVQWMKEH